jgi:D-glycero-beta-D-manno-heptose-7-phosphate kinase
MIIIPGVNFLFMLVEIVHKFPSCRIMVVGDLIADEFVYGEIARVSREAPVMILRYERTETMPGGAGNAAANVAALAGRAILTGVIGRDIAGRQLTLGLRSRGVSTEGLISLAGHTTPTKTRILAGSVHSTRQQVIRIDREPQGVWSTSFTEKLISSLEARLSQVDGIIISDYNYGVVSDELLSALRNALRGRQVPVVVDSRFRLKACRGFTAATPNQSELEELIKSRLTTEAELSAAGAQLRDELGLQALLLTRGGDGMMLFEEKGLPHTLDAVGSKEPVDVTGAGDTVIASFTLALAAGAGFNDAAKIANHAGGIVVMKRGTATVTREELIGSLDRNN